MKSREVHGVMTEFNEENNERRARSLNESPNTQSQTGRACWSKPTLKKHTTMNTDGKNVCTKEYTDTGSGTKHGVS
jgi:hypothetical protein